MHCSALAAIPINKQLCSFSYVCFTGGAAGIVLSAFYILVWFMFSFFYQKLSSISLFYRELTNNKKLRHSFFDGQIDVWGLRTPFLFLEWIGMNAMLVFVFGAQGILAAFVNGWYYKSPDNSLVSNKVCLRSCSKPLRVTY